MRRWRIGVWALAGWLGALSSSSSSSSWALGGAPRPQPVVTTQRAVVAPEAFKPTDPVMQSPQAAKALSATFVSAKFENTPAMEAFAELTKKTGYIIEPYEAGTNQAKYGRVTATITNQPFWAAVREICARGNVSLYYYGDDAPDRIQLMPSNYGQQYAMKAPVSIQGPYMTVLNHLDRVNNVSMSAPDKVDRRVNLQIHTFAEPKARPTQYAYQPTVTEAIDDNGNSMVPDPTDPQQQNMQSPRGLSFYGNIRLKYPTTNPGKRIARVRGHIDAKVRLSSEPWEIADPLKAAEQTKTFGTKKVTFKRFTKSGTGQYIAEFVFHRGDNEDAQEFQRNAFQTEPVLKLTDAGDGRYQSWAAGGSSVNDQATRQFTFQRRDSGGRRVAASPDAAEPTKLTLEVPTDVKDVAIPFELVDLPLP